MKRTTLTTILVACISLLLQAQTGFKWQGVAKDAAGNAVTQPVTLTFTILKNNTAVYAETQAPITPSGGLLTATVGAGTPSQGTFVGIDWSNGPFSLNVKMKISSGAVMDMGTSQVLPVPIALYAANSAGSSTWQTSAGNVFRLNGKVGVGTDQPGDFLNIYPKGSGGILIGHPNTSSGDFTSLAMQVTADQNGYSVIQSISKSGSLYGNLSMNPKGGNVGIETTSPFERFQIGDRWTFHNGGTKFIGYNTYYEGGNEKRIVSDEASQLRFEGNGDIVLRTAPYGEAGSQINFSPELTVKNNGNVGIGTSNPEKLLDVAGQMRGQGLDLKSAGPSLGFSNFNNKYLYWQLNSDGDIYLYHPALNKYRLFFSNNGNVGIGTNTPSKALEINGTTKTKILEIVGGDVAEARHSTTGEQLPAGSVVVFDEQEKGKIRLTSTPYDKKVAGVISGAGNYFAGVCLQQEELEKGAMPVAQVGTVEVLAVGPVEVGDLLTTSKIPGCAMKATNRRMRDGAVIGKATSSLKKGEKGLIEIQIEKH